MMRDLCIKPWDYTLGNDPNNTVLSGNVPKWGKYPVGVFPGCNTKTLRFMVRAGTSRHRAQLK